MRKFTLVWREVTSGESTIMCMTPDEARTLAAMGYDEEYDTDDSSVRFELVRVEDEEGEIVWEQEAQT